MTSFVHLHVHSEYSILNSTIRIGDLLDATRKSGMKAIALTDLSNMFGTLEFFKKSKEFGIQPIIGCELCVQPPRKSNSGVAEEGYKPKTEETGFIRLVLLCENPVGYKNLMKLATISHLKRGKKNPHVRMEHLRRHHDGLIAFTCCLEGENPSLPSHSVIEEARKLAIEFKDIFGSDNFNLEIQANGLAERVVINDWMIKLGQELQVHVVATGPVHYLNREEAGAYQVLRRMSPQTSVFDRNDSITCGDQLYLKSPGEMFREFSHVPDAIANTLVIAERCRFEISLYDFQFPMTAFAPRESVKDHFEKAVLEGFDSRLRLLRRKRPPFTMDDQKVYEERLRHEMRIICESGFPMYFLRYIKRH